MRRAIDAVLDYYDMMCDRYPDAGSSAMRMLDLLEEKVIPLLSSQPNIGRPFGINDAQSKREQAQLQAFQLAVQSEKLRAREWVINDFLLLYYVGQNTKQTRVYLISIRHGKQSHYF